MTSVKFSQFYYGLDSLQLSRTKIDFMECKSSKSRNKDEGTVMPMAQLEGCYCCGIEESWIGLILLWAIFWFFANGKG